MKVVEVGFSLSKFSLTLSVSSSRFKFKNSEMFIVLVVLLGLSNGGCGWWGSVSDSTSF